MGLSKYVAAALLVVMIVTYFVSTTIIKFIDKPYPIAVSYTHLDVYKRQGPSNCLPKTQVPAKAKAEV